MFTELFTYTVTVTELILFLNLLNNPNIYHFSYEEASSEYFNNM